MDITGKLMHFNNGQWYFIESLEQENIIYHSYDILDDKTILSMTVNTNYETTFQIFINGKWKKFDKIISVPVRYSHLISANEFWVCGDWGSLYHYFNGVWEEIDSPISNHIIAFKYLSPSDMWFGTRNQGIYHYDGQIFQKVNMTGYDKEDIIEIEFFSPTSGIACSNDGVVFQYNGNEFNRINTPTGQKFVQFQFVNPSFGMALNNNGKLYRFQDARWQSEDIPTTYRMTDIKLFKDFSGIIVGVRGLVLTTLPEEKLYFYNISGKSYTDGGTADISDGAAFVDLDNDSLIDIFVYNTIPEQLNRLYHNHGNSRFLDITGQSRLFESQWLKTYAFGDFNNDGLIDYAALSENLSQLTLAINYNEGKTRFRKPVEIYFNAKNSSVVTELEPWDFDNDGDLDLYLALHYGPGKKMGRNLLLTNRFFGHFTAVDSIANINAPGWNKGVLCADFNNDGWTDIFVYNYWKRDRLFLNNAGSFSEVTAEWLPDRGITNTLGAAAIDFDNDADLDLFTLSIEKSLTVYRNENQRLFRDITTEIGLTNESSLLPVYKSMNFGDFNNDGFIDLFVSNPNYKDNINRIFLNDSGRVFNLVKEITGLETPVVKGIIVGDIDNDGDLDLYGYRDGPNLLWLNNINNGKYLQIIPKGIRDGTGLGSKVWLYDTGRLDDPHYLRGYRQVGSDNPQTNMRNATRVHFGVELNKNYDVRVQFPGGKTKTLTNIPPGQLLVVYETEGIGKFFSILPGIIYRTITNSSFQSYSLMFILAVLIIIFTIDAGIKRYGWQLKIVAVIIILNLSAFWILVVTTENQSASLKFILPLIPVIIGTAIPLAIAHRFHYLKTMLAKDGAVREELLKQLLFFDHGEWALKNLNSLQLLSENALGKDTLSEKIITQFNERIQTFIDMTSLNLDKIIDLGKRTGISAETILSLEEKNKYVRQAFETIISANYKDYQFRFDNHRNIASSIVGIKTDLAYLKETTFSHFSSMVIRVIKNTIGSLEDLIREEGVEIKRIKMNIDDVPVLIPDYELAVILDNSIRNAIVAVRHSNDKIITIKVYRYPPAVRIDISDTGIGISSEEREHIFESGYSGFGNTGNGLSYAREILKKYSGRIFIKESTMGAGTTFTIELKEGKIQNEASRLNH